MESGSVRKKSRTTVNFTNIKGDIKLVFNL